MDGPERVESEAEARGEDVPAAFRPNLPGLRQVVLINSGIYKLAEIEIFNATELVALNGTGKSALINTLQFLYIDNERAMSFPGHATLENRGFYFKDAYHYLLFECRTYGGDITVGFRGTGAATGHRPNRFFFRGRYERDLFVDAETRRVREPGDVDVRLEGRHVQGIKDPAAQRAHLISGGTEKGAGWGLVPLRRENLYPRFKNSFRRLLHLRDVSQEELKEVLFDYAGLGATKHEIRFDRKFEGQLEEIEAGRARVERLEGHAGLIRECGRLFGDEKQLRRKVFALYREMGRRLDRFEEDFRADLLRLEAARDGENAELDRLQRELAGADDALEKLAEERAGPKRDLKAIREREAAFAQEGFDPGLKEMEIRTLSARVEKLTVDLARASEDTPESLRARIASARREAEETEAALDQIGRLPITVLRKHFNDAELGKVFGILDRGHLETPPGSGVEIVSEEGLRGRLAALLGQFDGDVFKDGTVEVAARKGAAERLAEIGDAETMRRRIGQRRAEAEELGRRLEVAVATEAVRAELEKTKADHFAAQRHLDDYRTLQDELKTVPALERRLAELDSAVAEQRGERGRLRGEIEVKRETLRAAGEAIGRLRSERNAVYEEHGTASPPPGEPPPDDGAGGAEPGGEALFPEELLVLIGHYKKTARDLGEMAERLGGNIGRLAGAFTGAYEQHPGDTAGFLEELAADLDAAGENREALDQHWRNFLTLNTATFRDLLKSKDTLARKTAELGKKMAAVEISNIRELRLEIRDNAGQVARVRTFAQGQDELSLFDDRAEVDRIMGEYRESVRRGEALRLADMFNVAFHVTHANGTKKVYSSFQDIVSTGTNVILKVLLNLVVIQAYLVPGKALIPFYLDEVHVLDRYNVRTILRMARELGFQAILAAPKVVEGIDACYHIVAPSEGGKLVVGEAQRQDFLPHPDAG